MMNLKTQYFKNEINNNKSIDVEFQDNFHLKHKFFGALVLNDGDVAEMKTGESKTLTATMPMYLNALTGKGVHVVT